MVITRLRVRSQGIIVMIMQKVISNDNAKGNNDNHILALGAT